MDFTVGDHLRASAGGGLGGHRAVALLARDWSPTQRATFRCWFNRRTRRYEVPTENCIYRVLKAVPVEPFQRAVWAWQQVRLGAADGDVVVLDGKAVWGSRGTQLVSAINPQSGRTLGVPAVAAKSNEIPAAQTLLQRLELDGMIALLAGRKPRAEGSIGHRRSRVLSWREPECATGAEPVETPV